MLEERRQEAIDPPAFVSELSREFLLVVFEAECVALQLVLFEDAIEFGSRLFVEHKTGSLVVPFEGTRIQVDTSYHRNGPVNHHDFAVMETAFVEEDMCTMSDKPFGKVEVAIG